MVRFHTERPPVFKVMNESAVGRAPAISIPYRAVLLGFRVDGGTPQHPLFRLLVMHIYYPIDRDLHSSAGQLHLVRPALINNFNSKWGLEFDKPLSLTALN